MAQIRSYGAHLKLVEGDRAATTVAVIAETEKTFYASHNWNPFFQEGTKTCAYEICGKKKYILFSKAIFVLKKIVDFCFVFSRKYIKLEQLGWKAPDCVVTPCGFGSVYLGLFIGFQELLENGIIEKMPKLFGVQSERCAPLYEATKEQKDEYEVKLFPMTQPTLAEV